MNGTLQTFKFNSSELNESLCFMCIAFVVLFLARCSL